MLCSKLEKKRTPGGALAPPKPLAGVASAATVVAAPTPPESGKYDDQNTLKSASTMYTAIEDNAQAEEDASATPAAKDSKSTPKSLGILNPEGKGSKEDAQEIAAGDNSPVDESSDDNSDVMIEVEYVMNPKFPDLPSSVPLTYTLAMHACLSAALSERPTFAQARNPWIYMHPSPLLHAASHS